MFTSAARMGRIISEYLWSWSVTTLRPRFEVVNRNFIFATALQHTLFDFNQSLHFRRVYNWKDGRAGALRMGLEHGMFCLGCCWLIMALLFVLGVMNLIWIAALTVFVFIEKIAPKGDWISRIGGIGFVIWGGFLFI
ncbi:MAG: DUF2182 domain-containing protein [SAR202 cluster bacterium]|nr:DUF2182 domain-containing protein [SAR202 cluster bacterium]